MPKRSANATLQITELEGFLPKVMHLHNLVENYAAAKVNPENYSAQIKRSGDQLKMKLMSVGLDNMSQLAGSIVMAAGRTGNQGTKTRTLRELVGSLRFQLDLSIRTVIREDELLSLGKTEAKEAKAKSDAANRVE